MNNDTYQRIYTKDEYLAELSRYLHKLPQDDYESAMAYFREYFEEAGPENEAQAMRDLGTPKEAASEILQNLLHDDNGARKNDTARTLKIAAIAMLLSPIGWLGLLFGGIFLVVAAAMIFAIIVSAVAVDAALFYSGGCLILAAFGMISESLSAAAFSRSAQGFSSSRSGSRSVAPSLTALSRSSTVSLRKDVRKL